MSIRYAAVRQQLIDLDHDDQEDMKGQYQRLQNCRTQKQKNELQYQLAYRSQQRAKRMLELLSSIQNAPTIPHIGIEGSQAVSVIALHANIDTMKYVLALYEKFYEADKFTIYYQAIPPLTDRIMILEKRIQRFGTNWFTDKDGKFFLIQVEDFAAMNHRRSQYDLGPAQKPRVLSYGAQKRPLGAGLAVVSDQKPLTDEEYAQYSKFHLSNVLDE